jgi:hypothetical protein
VTDRRSLPLAAIELEAAVTAASEQRMHRWLNEAPEHAAALEGKIIGTITWSRDVGRPDEPSLADGFWINHHFEAEEETAGPEGTPAPATTERDESPSQVWERETADEYIVGFLCDFGSRLGKHTITVKLTDVGWRNTSLHFGARTVVPRQWGPFWPPPQGFAAQTFEVLVLTAQHPPRI